MATGPAQPSSTAEPTLDLIASTYEQGSPSATPQSGPLGSESRPFEPLLTSKEAATLLGIHTVTVLRYAREGRLPHKKVGRKIAFRASELNAWWSSDYTGPAVRAAQPERTGA